MSYSELPRLSKSSTGDCWNKVSFMHVYGFREMLAASKTMMLSSISNAPPPRLNRLDSALRRES